MSFLAASLGLVISQPVGRGQESALWGRIERCIAVASSSGAPSGIGVLVDPSGLFLFHSSVMRGKGPWTIQAGARMFVAQLVSADSETGMALVKAPKWDAKLGTPVRMAAANPAKGDRVLAATPVGPRMAQVSTALVVGQMKPSLRYVPLAEVTLEDKGGGMIAGSAIFNGRGELIGMISAFQLEPGRTSPPAGFTRSADANLQILMQDSSKVFGPGSLTVGYTLGPSLLERVWQGLASPSGKVQHPSIGIYFKQHPQGGASVEAVMPGTQAEEAGLQVGDVIFEAGGAKIRGPVDLAIKLFEQRVGSVLTVKARRGSQVLDFSITVGTQEGEESLRSSTLHLKSDLP